MNTDIREKEEKQDEEEKEVVAKRRRKSLVENYSEEVRIDIKEVQAERQKRDLGEVFEECRCTCVEVTNRNFC